MLVLSRKTRQQIRIGDDITVTILLVKGQVVRVGIKAPVTCACCVQNCRYSTTNPWPSHRPRPRPARARPCRSTPPTTRPKTPVRHAAFARTRPREPRPDCSNCDAAAAWRG